MCSIIYSQYVFPQIMCNFTENSTNKFSVWLKYLPSWSLFTHKIPSYHRLCDQYLVVDSYVITISIPTKFYWSQPQEMTRKRSWTDRSFSIKSFISFQPTVRAYIVFVGLKMVNTHKERSFTQILYRYTIILCNNLPRSPSILPHTCKNA